MLRAGLLAAAVALLLSYILASNITDPIRRMSQVALHLKRRLCPAGRLEFQRRAGDLLGHELDVHEISVLVDNLTQEKTNSAAVEERQNMMSDISTTSDTRHVD